MGHDGNGSGQHGALPCLDEAAPDDALAAEIRDDLARAGTVLSLMRQYMLELHGSKHNDAPPLRKFAKLFELGSVPTHISGHHYGVTLGLRTGDLPDGVADVGNVIGWVWGVAIGKSCPWVGKSFVPMSEADRRATTGTYVPEEIPVLRGINHFNVIEHAPINLAGNALLDSMWKLDAAPADEQLRYGHERNGGHFAAYRTSSVWPASAREVLCLNYRFPALGNRVPLIHLIDELVEIAEGIYIGQLLFATRDLFRPYDATTSPAHYHYQHFGYFLLFEQAFDEQAQQLFPHLGIPASHVRRSSLDDKFTTLTLSEPPAGSPDAEQLALVRQDIREAGSILHMFKSYNHTLSQLPATDSPIFAKLAALFRAGIAPTRMQGFYYGALVSWLGQGLLGAFDVNSLNIVWQVCRPFSPWTGKRFDTIDAAQLAELSEGHETDAAHTQLGSNTVAFRSAREKTTALLMKGMHLWVEDADEAERREHGYHAKTFFFIGKPGTSVGADNHDKPIYQFNYRWKRLRNPPPDFLCIDELVRIADGLYLGQVYYATRPLLPWNPATPPSDYHYKLYEYFLLMDPHWHAQRLRIGYDLDNV